MIELRNCQLEISHVGTREQIDMEIFLERLPIIANGVAESLRLGLANAFEQMARGFCQTAKNLRR